ncbi:MAG: FRG domain-containing protein [Bacteroidales bacterium]|nr:FRG domain-containing protein [Bacteroidales bacterium]
MKITKIEEYLEYIDENISSWEKPRFIWFRGQPVDKELKPKLYRRYKYDENEMVQTFCRKALSLGETPTNPDDCDWLFLMQHYGLPTRLLDWTESSLIALYFALDFYDVEEKDKNPVVWVLNPLELNSVSVKSRKIQLPFSDIFLNYFTTVFGIGDDNEKHNINLPIAIASSHIDRRISAQKSCFTIQGILNEGMDTLFKDSLVEKNYLFKIKIDKDCTPKILNQLNSMGITHSTVFPDFNGLSKEIEEQYRRENNDSGDKINY